MSDNFKRLTTELSLLKEELNFPEYDEIKKETEFWKEMQTTVKNRTDMKIEELLSLIFKQKQQPKGILVLSTLTKMVVSVNKEFAFNIPYLGIIARGFEDEKKISSFETKYQRNMISGVVKHGDKHYLNDGKIWEKGMVKYNLELINKSLKERSFLIDFAVADMLSVTEMLEESHVSVKRSELDIILPILNLGGNMIMKFNGISCDRTREIIEDIMFCFKDVFLYKPKSSNPMNDEIFLICKFLERKHIEKNGKLKKKVEDMCYEHLMKQKEEIKQFLLLKQKVLMKC